MEAYGESRTGTKHSERRDAGRGTDHVDSRGRARCARGPVTGHAQPVPPSDGGMPVREVALLATRAGRSRGRNRAQPTRSAQVLNLKGLRRGLLENPKGEQGGESDADHRQHPEQLACRAAPS